MGFVWSWACGDDSTTVWKQGHFCFSPCFGDTVLLSGAAVLSSISLLWTASQGRYTSGHPVKSASGLAHYYVIETLSAAATLPWLIFITLSAIRQGPIALITERPHVILAGLSQATAWLVSLAVIRSRHASSGHAHFPRHLWLLWHIQPIVAAAVAIPPLCYGSLALESIPLLMSAAVELLFVAALDWELFNSRKKGLSDIEEQLLPEGEHAGVGEAGRSWASQLAFAWVTPLMSLGSRRRLQHDDLLDLPPELHPAECRRVMWGQWKQAGESGKGGAEGVGTGPTKLWPALWGAYGWPYISLGLLKLVGDSLNFAGPLLLNALLRYLKEVHHKLDASNDGLPVIVAEHLGEQKSLWFPPPGSLAYGCGCVALLGLAAVLKAVLNAQYSFRQGALACRLRSALTCLVHDKTLLVSSVDMAAFSSGEVQTLMSVDADRVVNLFSSLHELWSLPLQIAIALCLLYTQVRLAFLAGLAVVLALIPVNRWLSKRIEAASAEMMGCKDARIRRTGELLRGIRQIKAAAWEPAFLARVEEARQGELAALAVCKYLDAFCVYFWAATSLLTSILTFSLFVLLGHALSAQLVFTSLALFGVLIAPLNSFPWVINGCVEAVVSVRRLQRFLSTKELSAQWDPLRALETVQPSPEGRLPLRSSASTLSLPFPNFFGDTEAETDRLSLSAAAEPLYGSGRRLSLGQSAAGCAVLFQDASFTWVSTEGGAVTSRTQPSDAAAQGENGGRDVVFRSAVTWWASDLALTELCLALPFSSLTAVVGDVGSGKSSLLAAVLGELQGVAGRVRVCGSLAYVPQQPWIMSATVRDNILFKRPFEEARYAAVVAACCLKDELRALPAGDQTWVGDRGTTLSGGQAARLALARALYQDSDVYLLDDVLAAVDAPVAAELWERAIAGPLLRNKTRLVVTHSRRFAAAADALLRLERGRVAYLGPPDEDPYGLQLWTPGIQPDKEETSKGKAKLHEKFQRRMASSMPTQPLRSITSPLGGATAKPAEALKVTKPPAVIEQLAGTTAGQTEGQAPAAAPINQNSGEEQEEARQTGHVKPRVYASYASAAGTFLVSIIAISLTLMQVTQNGSDLWLTYWVSHQHHEEVEAAGVQLAVFNITALNATNEQDQPWEAMSTFQPIFYGAPGHCYVWPPQSGFLLGAAVTPRPETSGRPEDDFREGSWWESEPIVHSTRQLRETAELSKAVFDSADGHDGRENGGQSDSAQVTRASSQGGDEMQGRGGRTHGQMVLEAVITVRDYLHDQAAWLRHYMWRSVAQLQPDVQFYLGVLLMLTLANSISILVRAFSFASGGLVAAQRLHERLLAAVVAAPAAFFSATPAGRILNRFSSDTATADDSLPFILNILLAVLFSMLGTLGVLTYSQPLLAAAFIPLALIYRWLQGYYRHSAREIRRLGSVARSPVYAGFSEALDGAATIRGFGAQAAFSRRNVDRLLTLQKANFAGLAAAQWLSLRLQLLAGSVVTLMAGLSVAGSQGLLPSFASQARGQAGAGLVGLSLSYALAITGLLNGLLTSFAETEQEMVAVERILEYTDLEPQASTREASTSEEGETGPLPSSWPERACVSYVDVKLRYSSSASLALDELSLDVKPGQKVGICGRTGAGKSSLVGALLRLTEIEGGSILVDGHDIRDIPLQRLRSAIGSVPQTPFLFQGSIRENLDPMGRHSDRELIGVLKVTRLWDILCGFSLSQAKGYAQRSAPLPTAQQQRIPSATGTPPGLFPRTPPGASGTPPRSLQAGHPIPPRHRPSSAPSTSYLAPAESPSSSERTSPLAEEVRAAGGAGASSSYAPGEALFTGHRGRQMPRSRFVAGWPGGGGGSFAESLARESTGVLVHSGFGGQLLSVRLGEGGVGLSQGQQQLLCLARVLLQRPSILCLDECTANVDASTAHIMQDLIAAHLRHATILQVAHRLESVMGCDAVVVMEEGRIVETGLPMQLLAAKGSRFAAMHRAAQRGSMMSPAP